MTQWTVVCQTPLSKGFFRLEYQSGLPYPPPGDLPDPGFEPESLLSSALADRFLNTCATWSLLVFCNSLYFSICFVSYEYYLLQRSFDVSFHGISFWILSLSVCCSVMSNYLWPCVLQHARLPYPSLSPRVYSNSRPLSRYCHPTILSSVAPFSCPQFFPASGSFPVGSLHRWPKYWSFSFSISPSSEYSGLISFRIDWFDLLSVQGTLKSLLQQSLKAPVLPCSTFFMV